MANIFECENMDELLTCLSEVFEDNFADIILDHYSERECDDNQLTNDYLN